MTPFTVYLVARNALDGNKSRDEVDRRLRALRALHDELDTIGIRVTPLPELADLDVQITNVFLAGDSQAAAGHVRTCADRGRIMSIRLSVSDDDHVDMVCSDGMDRVTAERYAARRILMWLDGLSRPPMTDLVHAPTA